MLAKLDRRTKEGKALAELRDELTRHVGGAPSAVQRVLITIGRIEPLLGRL